MTEARQILVDATLNLRDTLTVRDGAVKLGHPWIALQLPPSKQNALFDRARERATPRELAFIEANRGDGLQSLVLEPLITSLREAGHDAVADLGEFAIGQHFRLVIEDPDSAAVLDQTLPAAEVAAEAAPAPYRLWLERLAGAAAPQRIALGELPPADMDGILRTAAYVVAEKVHQRAWLLTPAELAEMLVPTVVAHSQYSQDDLNLYTPALPPHLTKTPLSDRRCALIWRASASLRKHLGTRAYYGNEGSLQDKYSLELYPNGRLFLKYQTMLGGPELAQLDEQAVADLVARRNAAVQAFNDGQTAEERQARPTGTVIVRREPLRSAPATPQATSPVETTVATQTQPQPRALGESAQAGADDEVGSVPRPSIASADPVAQQLALLRADGNRIVLPEQQLSEYAAIRDRMLKAGFKYKRKGGVCFFEGHADADAAAILSQLTSGDRVNIQKETQFFGTPPKEAEDVIHDAGVTAGMRVLEPSAGNGGLADPARARGAEVITVENWDINAQALRDKGYTPIERDFLEVTVDDIGGLVDAVVMNPPFTKGQDIRHVQHALGFLKPDGVLASITSNRAGLGATKPHKAFARILELAGAERTDIEAGAFKASGTSVATARLRIEMAPLLEAIESEARDRGDADSTKLEKELGIDLAHVRRQRDADADRGDQEADRPRERG